MYLLEGSKIDVYFEEEAIILKKHNEICVFCSNGKNLLVFKNKCICKKCIKEIKEK